MYCYGKSLLPYRVFTTSLNAKSIHRFPYVKFLNHYINSEQFDLLSTSTHGKGKAARILRSVLEAERMALLFIVQGLPCMAP